MNNQYHKKDIRYWREAKSIKELKEMWNQTNWETIIAIKSMVIQVVCIALTIILVLAALLLK